MKKNTIIVPKGIKFVSDWTDYSLENYQYPHILNKQITGCGFTEYCLTNNINIILLSPRKLLLQNKEDQHKGKVYYFRNELEKIVNYDKEVEPSNKSFSGMRVNGNSFISKEQIIKKEQQEAIKRDNDRMELMRLKREVMDYWAQNHKTPIPSSKPCKILVTYDSFRHVKEALGENIDECYVVVDEFQSILGDSRFKSTTEIELLYQLKDLKKVCFVSATPMMDEYLEMLDEFKDLPYFEFDWEKEEPSRVIRPTIDVKFINKNRAIESEANKIVQDYLDGKFDRYVNPDGSTIISNEGVFYVNSVKSICRIIKKNNLTPDNTNVLCAKTDANERKIQEAFGLTKKELKKKYGLDSCLGTIPTKDEPHKMFTLCTRTVYLGADFYSTCARSFIFSDANVDSLSLDISMDLEQILGRQRLVENPWKNRANLYIRTRIDIKTEEEFLKVIKKKEEVTKYIIGQINNSIKGAQENPSEREGLTYYLSLLESSVLQDNYSKNYLSFNHHVGKGLVPVFNTLVKVSELRAFHIQQTDYRDRFMVMSGLDNAGITVTNDEMTLFMIEFNSRTEFPDKLRYLCEEMKVSEEIKTQFLNYIPIQFKNCYETLGPIRCRALGYVKSYIEREYDRLITQNQTSDQVSERVFGLFSVGKRYTREFIKKSLVEIYNELGRTDIPKASDLENWFEIKQVKIPNKETGKRDPGFEIVSRK